MLSKGADLSGAKFHQVSLKGVNLSYAQLCGAILEEVNFDNANLSNADFSGAVVEGKTILPD
ncbi:pentapeptide repeat-containing protein [Okeania sp.]|uniref:pentapeptide repeat-containing protein n=1 Tax=Okeania sp. TaxID=3100323 RepID=UPI002B4B9532|nr:pentapeptide repeat-containing protein [Okeania sp.]MEB3341219.1 pentapeptide repeat-containing protein [Okeania sp.]